MKHYPDETIEVPALLNGAAVDLIMGIDRDWDGDVNTYLWAVMFEGGDVTPILSRETLDSLESDGLAYLSDLSFENRNV